MLAFPTAWKILRDLGPAWVVRRIGFAVQGRLGILKHRMPASDWDFHSSARPSGRFSDSTKGVEEAFGEKRRFFFSPDELPQPHLAAADICEQANRVLKGECLFFAHKWLRVGFPPDWHLNAMDGTRVANDRHWSKIDLNRVYETKYVWEPSRFSVVYLLARAYAASGDERYVEAFWELVEDWAHHNRPNCGVNWASGQEASLRVMAWCFGLHAFLNSSRTTPDRVLRMVRMIEKHGERIAGFIEYALAQRNNHGISEAVGLFTMGLLFSKMRRAAAWTKLGRALITRQASEQIYADGSYIQHSFNYQRVLIDNLVWALRLGELNDCRFLEETYAALGRAVRFMLRFCDPQTGQMPNYGSNDGSLVLPLSSCDFTDYRPSLQAANFLVNRELCFGNGPWNEQTEWLFPAAERPQPSEPLPRSSAAAPSFESPKLAPSGYVRLEARESYAMLRASRILDRPSQADQLHLDLWWRGENIACDAGTYLYNGPQPWTNGLADTAVHNTVSVAHRDQMTRVARFLWVDWAQAKSFRYNVGDCGAAVEAWHDGYKNVGATHRRSVLSCKCEDFWIVVDDIIGSFDGVSSLHWLFSNYPYEWRPDEFRLDLAAAAGAFRCWISASEPATVSLLCGGKPIVGKAGDHPKSLQAIRGWRSLYYGEKELALSLALEVRARLPVRFVTILAPSEFNANTRAGEIQLQRERMTYTVRLHVPGMEQVFSAVERVDSVVLPKWDRVQ